MGGNGWSIEVVRGREAGRVYALDRDQIVLGNGLEGGPGIDLAHQEGDSPRRMAARQAQLDLSPRGLTLSDLESPGGTFVNRQRLLPGQARTLQAGDLIQLGGVQLKVVAGGAAPPPVQAAPRPSARPIARGASTAASAAKPTPAPPGVKPALASSSTRLGPLPGVFTLANGSRCRSWDDFLTVSAQRWSAMRDELVSGRLAAFLASAGRGDLAPSAQAEGTPDERLDAWLGTLPTTRPSRPELEVHPPAIKLRAVPGGGMTRTRLQITNTGYRLLRTTVRIEPGSASWIKIGPEFARGPIVTVDQTDVPIDVHLPDRIDESTYAVLVLDSNGGTRRVEIRLERPADPGQIARAHPPVNGADSGSAGPVLADLIAGQSIGHRLIAWSLLGLLLRVLVVAGGYLPTTIGGEASPPLSGVAVVLAMLGCGTAVGFAIKRGEPRDLPSAGFAGGFAGLLSAAVLVAACRSIEPLLGPRLSGSPAVVCLLWGLLGAVLATLSARLIPPRTSDEALT